MPLALSTALQFSIVIFSKDSRTPIMYVTPDNVASEATAFVVYNPEGEGHYIVALPTTDAAIRQAKLQNFMLPSASVG